MNSRRQRENADFALARMYQYPHKVATKRNGNTPRPETVEAECVSNMCRIPLGTDYILWMFDTASDADHFRKKYIKITCEILEINYD